LLNEVKHRSEISSQHNVMLNEVKHLNESQRSYRVLCISGEMFHSVQHDNDLQRWLGSAAGNIISMIKRREQRRC